MLSRLRCLFECTGHEGNMTMPLYTESVMQSVPQCWNRTCLGKLFSSENYGGVIAKVCLQIANMLRMRFVVQHVGVISCNQESCYATYI